MIPTVVPSLLTKSRAEFARKLKIIEKETDLVQVDILDGKFAPNKTWFDAKAVAKMKTDVQFELDIMAKDPLAVVKQWMKVPGLRRVIFHVESPIRMSDAIRVAHDLGLEVGLGISPGTPLTHVTDHLKQIDMVLVMGNMPGFSGKPLDSNAIDTVRAIRKKSKKINIGFDIGVSRHTIPTLVQAGVTQLCAASAVFTAKVPCAELRALRRIAKRASGTV